MNGTLSIVATPIGNLADITFRAVETLKNADTIFAEDTRVTKVLCAKYDIETPVCRYDAHTSTRVHEAIIEKLESGEHITLVSDAGTPCISDPGVLLVQRAREAGARIEAIPGPSAVTAALSIAGAVGNRFTFLGFAPQKKGRQTFFNDINSDEYTVVFYESVHRMEKTLATLTDILSEDRQIGVARELTKMHEEFVKGTAVEVGEYFNAHPDHMRGEFVVIVYPYEG